MKAAALEDQIHARDVLGHGRDGRDGARAGEIGLLEGDDPARNDVRRQMPQGFCGVGEVEHDEPADQRVEFLALSDLRKLRLAELNIGDLRRRRALARAPQALPVPVDSDNRSRRPDEPRGKQRDVAHPAADVENAHARTQARPLEHLRGQFIEEGALTFQSIRTRSTNIRADKKVRAEGSYRSPREFA